VFVCVFVCMCECVNSDGANEHVGNEGGRGRTDQVVCVIHMQAPANSRATLFDKNMLALAYH